MSRLVHGRHDVALRRGPGTPSKLRMLTGLYWYRLTEEAGRQVFEDIWTFAAEADRMSYLFKGRLIGPAPLLLVLCLH